MENITTCFFTFESLQYLHNEYVMGKFNLLLYLGGKKVEFLVVMFLFVCLGGGRGGVKANCKLFI